MPDRIGPYRLFEKLGVGGMGTAYRAEDTRTGAIVALKLLHPHLAEEPDAVARMQREARIVAGLHHPNVVRVLDSGQEGEHYYVALEYINGETLQQCLLREGRLSEAETERILRTVAGALEAASMAAIVHRDIKPSNILLARDGGILVSDFGVARRAEFSTMTQRGAFLGTPAYAAPEALSGAGDVRADLYSCGLVAYQALVGALRIESKAADEKAKPIRVNMRALRHVAPQLHPLIAKLLQRDPDRRFQSPSELREALLELPPLETAIVDDEEATVAVGRVAFRRRSVAPDLASTWWRLPRGARVGGTSALVVIAAAGAILGAAFMFGGGSTAGAPKAPPPIVTGKGWDVYESDWVGLDDETWETNIFSSKREQVPGGTQVVCLEDDCTGEDTAYKYSGEVSWGEIDGAFWVWAAGVKPTDAAGDRAYFFEKEFSFDGAAAKRDYVAMMTFAFDNGVRVFVDGNENKEGVNVEPGTPQTVDVTKLFSDGPSHTIVLWGVNAECETPCTYKEEPAGIIVRIEFLPKEDAGG